MAFQRKRKVYELDFTGTGLEGLTMKMRGMVMAEAFQLSSLRDMAEIKDLDQQMSAIRTLFEFVAERIISWDMIDENGESIEPTADALMSLDTADAFATLDAWQKAVEGVSAPLDNRSSGGGTSGTSETDLPPLPMPS